MGNVNVKQILSETMAHPEYGKAELKMVRSTPDLTSDHS